LNGIKKYYDFLLDTGKREDHPCHSLYLKGNTRKGIIQSDLFTMAELETLMNREEKFSKMVLKNQALISLLIYQGLLPGEITRLKVSDINLDTGTVHIHGGRVLTSRTLELHIKQIRIFDKYINEARQELLIQENNESLFIGYQGHPDSTENINYIIYTMKGAFPSRVLTTRTIRDSVISYWLNDKKLPLEQVQLMAGHRWISSTERYKQESLEEQREMLRKIHPLG
jgi:integrase/recombinase XerD